MQHPSSQSPRYLPSWWKAEDSCRAHSLVQLKELQQEPPFGAGTKIQATIQLTPLEKPLYATCMGYLGTTMYAWDLTLQAVPKSTKFKGYLIKVCLVISAIEDEILIVQVVGRTRASSHFVISLSYPEFCQYHMSPTYQSNDWLCHL